MTIDAVNAMAPGGCFDDEKQRKSATSDLAGVEGFEPPYGGIKTRCLTTWRHPSKFH